MESGLPGVKVEGANEVENKGKQNGNENYRFSNCNIFVPNFVRCVAIPERAKEGIHLEKWLVQ